MQVLQQEDKDQARTTEALRTECLLHQYENGSYCIFERDQSERGLESSCKGHETTIH